MIDKEVIKKRKISLLDSQFTKDKNWLYRQMIQAIKERVKDSIILVFSPTILSNLMNYAR